MSVGDNIYYSRSRVGMSQEDLAESLNVPVQLVADWELRMTKPDMDQIHQMCGLFSCPLEDLLRGESQIERVSDDFVKQYERHMKSYANMFSLAVGLIFFGVGVLLILLSRDSSNAFIAICLTPVIMMTIHFGVKSSKRHDEFVKKHPQLPTMFTKERIEKEEIRLGFLVLVNIAIAGFAVFLLVRRSTLPVLSEMGTLFSVGVFLLVLSIAVMMFVNLAIRLNIYDVSNYNKENAPKKSQ